MNYVFTAFVFIVIFSVLVLVHELGHFLMAKRAGIKVEEFGLGLPPRIFGRKKGETVYSINWIPFGGFVRMLGEDSSDPSMLKKKRSFISQPMRSRVFVIVAGVVMNFILAWFLLTVGFTAGMQPLFGPDDVFDAIDDGVIDLTVGLKVASVVSGGVAESIGFSHGDILYGVDGDVIGNDVFSKLDSRNYDVFNVLKDGKKGNIINEKRNGLEDSTEFGAEFENFMVLPRVKIFSVAKRSAPYRAGLLEGDVILRINGTEIFSASDFEDAIKTSDKLKYEIYRDGEILGFYVEKSSLRRVIVSQVLDDSPAKEIGLLAEDIIISVNGLVVSDPTDVIDIVSSNGDVPIKYEIFRGNQKLFYEIRPNDGRIGVMLSELVSADAGQNFSLYNTGLVETVVKINEEKYPFYESAYRAVGETYRLSKLTAVMFVSFVKGFFSSGQVPDSVAGPVGIAQLTHTFVQEGIIPLLRFTAILSLSLGVINILPFPALDGGRLLFIIFELFLGRKVNQKWESYIHMFGYVLILGLILVVTYSDILRVLS